MTPKTIKIVEDIIEELFQKVKFRLLGPNYVSKAFIFSLKNFNPADTLASLYVHAASQHSVSKDSIDPKTIERINKTFDSYLDVLSTKTKENTTTVIRKYLHEADVKSKLKGMIMDEFLRTEAGSEIKNNVSKEVSSIIDKADNHIKMLVNDQMHNAQALGALDGIVGVSKSLDIEDPVVFKIGVIDEKMCAACRKLWHLADINTPKLYKLSDLKGGYENLKDPTGTIGPTHPNCRHVLTTLLPGFGFSEAGKVTYIGSGHDEYSKQNS